MVSIGDRVEFVALGLKTGTVTGIVPPKDMIAATQGRMIALVMRDDGVKGSGPNGEWKVWVKDCIVRPTAAWGVAPSPYTPPSEAVKGKSEHKMGLDPEMLDMDAFREFMKGL